MQSQWVSAGLEALRKDGIAGVRIERLAAELGITKGSFYWHFRDRGELLEALLEYWAREMTEAEFERIEAVEGGLAQRLLALAEDVLDRGMGRYDPAIRSWARAQRKVAAAVAQVDRRRIRALTALFEADGFSAAEARTRARLFYAFLLGEPQVRSPAREPGELERMIRIFSG